MNAKEERFICEVLIVGWGSVFDLCNRPKVVSDSETLMAGERVRVRIGPGA